MTLIIDTTALIIDNPGAAIEKVVEFRRVQEVPTVDVQDVLASVENSEGMVNSNLVSPEVKDESRLKGVVSVIDIVDA